MPTELTHLRGAALALIAVLVVGSLLALSARITALESAPPLSNASPIIVRYVADGVDIAPPDTLALWEYVTSMRAGIDYDLRAAIESDLHAGDSTFHLTHEAIDGRRW